MADDFKNVTVQLTPDLLTQVDERAARLDLNRSQYFRRLARLDLEKAYGLSKQSQPEHQKEAA